MKILSWDIGFHHISFCKLNFDDAFVKSNGIDITNLYELSKYFSIELWKVWSVTEQWCQFEDHEGKKCCTSSNYVLEEPLAIDIEPWKKQNQVRCLKHAFNSFSNKKKEVKENIETFFNIDQTILDKNYCIPCNFLVRGTPCCERGIQSKNKIEDSAPEPIYQMCSQHYKKYSSNLWKLQKKQSTQDWITWGKKIYIYLQQQPEIWNDVDHVLIENQPSMKNPTMKTYQSILSSFFLIKSLENLPNLQIHLLSATNKNKVPFPPTEHDVNGNQQLIEKGKSSYKDNKNSSILCTTEWLKYKEWSEWEKYFTSFHKKDDLADSFLQGLYYIQILYLNNFAINKKKSVSKKKNQKMK